MYGATPSNCIIELSLAEDGLMAHQVLLLPDENYFPCVAA